MLDALVHSAHMQDRDGTPSLIGRCPAGLSIVRFFADGSGAGQKLRDAIARSDGCRRLAENREAAVASIKAWLAIVSIKRMTRHIATIGYGSPRKPFDVAGMPHGSAGA